MSNLKYNLFLAVSALLIVGICADGSTIDIDSLALWAGGNISMGSGVAVDGAMASADGISSGSSVNLGSVYTESNVWLGNNSSVTGDVIAVGNIDFGRNVTVSGLVDNDDFTLPPLDTLQSNIVGTESVYGSKYSKTTLLAGDYSNISISRNSILNLSAGEYNMGSFYMNRDGVVNIDTTAGDVILNINGSFSTSRDVSFVKSGSGSLYVNVFGHSAWLDDNVSLDAYLKVYGGNFGADKGVELAGTLYATGNIWLGNDSQFVAIADKAVPEPATVAFLSIGLLLMTRKRKAA